VRRIKLFFSKWRACALLLYALCMATYYEHEKYAYLPSYTFGLSLLVAGLFALRFNKELAWEQDAFRRNDTKQAQADFFVRVPVVLFGLFATAGGLFLCFYPWGSQSRKGP
jgi:hypothetical protein